MQLYEVRRSIASGKTIYDLPLRVTYYARVSTSQADQLHSLQNQVEFFQNYICKNPKWQFVDGYIDEGISGTSVTKRENFLKMIEDAKEGRFDLIVTKEISRFARSTLDSIRYTQELIMNNVGVFFLNDNINTYEPDSELRLTIMSSLVQEEVRKISSRVKFGHKQAIKNGRVLGNDYIWGYKKDDGKLRIVDEEAEVVRLMYDLYVSGYGINTIAKKLYDKGIRNRAGNKFTYSTIKSILTNPKYKGYYAGNKSEKIDYRHNRRVFFSRSEWELYEADPYVVPAIVDEETWEKANALLKERSEKQRAEDKTVYNDRSIYSGKIICMEHNKSYWRNVYKYKSGSKECWQCKEYRRGGKAACRSPLLYTEDIKRFVGAILKELLKDRDKIVSQLMETYSKILAEEDYSREIEVCKERINKLKERKDKLLDLFMDGAIAKKEFRQRNDEMNAEMESMERHLEEYEEIQKRKRGASEELANIKAAIEQSLSFDPEADNDKVIATLQERIEVYPKDEYGVINLNFIFKTGAKVPALVLSELSANSSAAGNGNVRARGNTLKSGENARRTDNARRVHSSATIHMISKECTRIKRYAFSAAMPETLIFRLAAGILV